MGSWPAGGGSPLARLADGRRRGSRALPAPRTQRSGGPGPGAGGALSGGARARTRSSGKVRWRGG